MATVITWRSAPHNFHDADAQKCHEEMGSENVTPESVLEKARDESTELHKCFEWDDGIAAEKFRLSQARQIIQMIVVTEVEDKKPVGEQKRVFQISSEPHVYQPIKFFKDNADEYDILLKRAKKELVAFKNRYEKLSELEEVFEAIEKIV